MSKRQVKSESSSRRRGAIAIQSSLTLILAACTADPTGDAYLFDGSYRRAVLEASLWRPELPYSRNLLGSYGHENEGWDLLPESAVQSEPFTVQEGEAAEGQDELDLISPTDFSAAELPTTEEEWIALGKKVFFEFPLRSDPYLSWLASTPSEWGSAGLERYQDGTLSGLVKYRAASGTVDVALTCASCHAEGGIAGRATRYLNLGYARARFGLGQGRTMDQLDQWGPGRVDVTDDDVDSPTAIPDLWGLAYARHINHSGVIRVVSPATLAIRFETQYMLNGRLRSRPPRVLIWALTKYVLSLSPPPESPQRESNAQVVTGGRRLFMQRCSGCHHVEEGYSGDLVAVDRLNSDETVARTPERGTGHYRVPSLINVRNNAPYLHDGSVASLTELLDGGHPVDERLTAEEKVSLVAFLETL